MKRRILLLLLLSMPLGEAMSFFPWGDPKRDHGMGIPFPIVFWDHSRYTNDYVPYDGPAGFVLNPMFYSVVCLGGYACYKFISYLTRPRLPAPRSLSEEGSERFHK